MHWKMLCVKRGGKKISDIFLMLCPVSIEKPVSFMLFLVNFTVGQGERLIA